MNENMNTIYNVAVKMESQEQCDRVKQLFIDKKVPYSGLFIFDSRGDNDINYVIYCQSIPHLRADFSVNSNYIKKEEINETDFLELLNNHKGEF